jgi:hypothetical protein
MTAAKASYPLPSTNVTIAMWKKIRYTRRYIQTTSLTCMLAETFLSTKTKKVEVMILGKPNQSRVYLKLVGNI